jgi:hypothetical protein
MRMLVVFAGTVWTEKTKHLALINLKAEGVNGEKISVAFTQFADFNHEGDGLTLTVG